MNKVICPYCNSEAVIVKGDKIYPHRPDLKMLNFWYCDNGHNPAYVGCHKISIQHGYTGEEPLGRLADAKLRRWKSKAHAAFDPLWKEGIFKSRNRAYNWLANKLQISKEECHIGMMSVKQCRQVIEVCNERLPERYPKTKLPF